MTKRVSLPLGVGLFLVGSLLGAQAQVTVNLKFVPRKEIKEKRVPDPAGLNDVARVNVDATSASGIARITFEVDDQFRLEATKPPYNYDWDTLNEQDGEHTLAVTAYNTNGQTGVKRLKVKVENKLNLGIKHFADLTLTAFRKGDAEEVARSARRAFKINPADPLAARAMALNVGLKGDIGRAFQILDDRQVMIPKDDPITEEIRGFLLIVRAAKAANIPAMLPDLQLGLALMQKTSELYIERIKAAHPESEHSVAGQTALGDALFSVNRLEEAQAAYQRAADLASGPPKWRVQQRLALVLLRQGRLQAALLVAKNVLNNQEADATSAAVYGAILFQKRQYLEAREAVREGAKKRNIAALAVAAMADLAMGLRVEAYKEARDAVNAADMAETQYVGQAALADAGDPVGAKQSFQLAFIRLPLFMPTLIARAYETMAYEKAEDRFVQARHLLDLVVRLDSQNAAAQAARLVAMIQQKHYTQAQNDLNLLATTDPTAPDLFVIKAALATRTDSSGKSSKAALDYAHRLDPTNYKDAFVPDMTALALRITRLRRTVPLTPELLDRADSPDPVETAGL